MSFENKMREPGLSAEPVLQPVQTRIQTQVGNCGLPRWTADFEFITGCYSLNILVPEC